MDGTPFGRYRLIELLGRGGMGGIWRACDTETDRVVAIEAEICSRSGCRSAGIEGLGHPQLDTQRNELLLRTVVQIAL